VEHARRLIDENCRGKVIEKVLVVEMSYLFVFC
jgi:hypothetical protein